MGFKEFFIKETKKPEPLVKNEARPVPVTNFGPSGGNSTTAMVGIPQSGTDYFKTLDDALAKAAKPEVDFFKFNQIIEKSAGQPIAEPQKYQNAFMALETVGLSYGRLLSSADHYVGVLDSEAADFGQGLAQARKTEVDDKNKEVERLTQLIKEQQEKLQQLSTEAFQANTKLLAEEQAFNNALNIKKSTFTDRIQKIQQYLGYANTTK